MSQCAAALEDGQLTVHEPRPYDVVLTLADSDSHRLTLVRSRMTSAGEPM